MGKHTSVASIFVGLAIKFFNQQSMVIPRFEYKLFASEAIGTALLLFFGLSIVIFNWGEGSIVAKLIPSELLRTIPTGFMFGCVGCLVALSGWGR